jgi:hypothetical protein
MARVWRLFFASHCDPQKALIGDDKAAQDLRRVTQKLEPLLNPRWDRADRRGRADLLQHRELFLGQRIGQKLGHRREYAPVDGRRKP